MTEATNYLDFCVNNERINNTDKQEILLLHNNLETYNYDEVFSPDAVCKFDASHMNLYRTIENNADYLLLGSVIHKNKNRIFKIWVTNKDHPYSNDVCFQMLMEYHFQNIYRNNITDSIVIVPQTYNYGKVILNANNEILYFYEMEYYDSVKYVLDSMIDLDNENMLSKILYFHDILENGCEAIRNVESSNPLVHADYGYDTRYFGYDTKESLVNELHSDSSKNSEEYLSILVNSLFQSSKNILIYNNKMILIDFGRTTRNKTRYKSKSTSIYDYNDYFSKRGSKSVLFDDVSILTNYQK